VRLSDVGYPADYTNWRWPWSTNGSRSQASKMFDLAMNLDEQVSHMMNELEQSPGHAR
jgi:hypothetical protein